MAARVGEGVARLRPEWIALLQVLPQLGRVWAVTSNRCVTLRKCGAYPAAGISSGRVLHSPVRLGVNLCFWASAFAVVARPGCENSAARSLHFYGRDGAPVHELHLVRASSVRAFEDLVEEFVSRNQSRRQTVDPDTARLEPVVFSRLHHGEEEMEVLPLHSPASGGERTALRLPRARVFRFLQQIVLRRTPVAVTVANAGCVQTHSGRFRKIVAAGGGWNMTGDGIDLCFSEESIAGAWVLKGPAAGCSGRLELFNAQGRGVASLAPERTAGPEIGRQWLEALARLDSQLAAA